jgi:hypothetical protein
VLCHQALGRLCGGQRAQLAHQLADGESELHGAAGLIAMPERHLAWLARRRRHEHAIVRNLLDAPGGGTKREGLANFGLEDHLLVQLADSRRAIGAREEYAVEAAIWNRSRVGDGHAFGAGASRDASLQAIPRDARAQFRELVGRITSRDHVEDALEGPPAQIGKRRRAAHRRKQLVHRPGVERGHRDDLLGEDVERVARIAGRLDAAFVHRA